MHTVPQLNGLENKSQWKSDINFSLALFGQIAHQFDVITDINPQLIMQSALICKQLITSIANKWTIITGTIIWLVYIKSLSACVCVSVGEQSEIAINWDRDIKQRPREKSNKHFARCSDKSMARIGWWLIASKCLLECNRDALLLSNQNCPVANGSCCTTPSFHPSVRLLFCAVCFSLNSMYFVIRAGH